MTDCDQPDPVIPPPKRRGRRRVTTPPPAGSDPNPAPEPPRRSWQTQADLHRMILDRLGPSPLAEDQLLRDLDLSPQQAAPELLTLELEGHIQRAAGGLLSRMV